MAVVSFFRKSSVGVSYEFVYSYKGVIQHKLGEAPKRRKTKVFALLYTPVLLKWGSAEP